MAELQLDIAVNNVGFKYPAVERQVLKDLKFSIPKGSFVGIIGPNGCGKTTLLKCITKLLVPESGEIQILGGNLQQLSNRELARRVGVVPQKFDLSFAFTAEEVVRMGRFPHKGRFQRETQEDQQIIEFALKVTNTWHLRERLITQISGGELQRVVIAQALAQSPEVLLLDEATSNLDINHQVDIFDLIKELNQTQGLTVVSIMHDLNLAAQYCNTLIMLKDGKVYAVGEPAQVLTKDNIRVVYGAKVRVRLDPVTKRPHISPYPGLTTCCESRGTKVHVVAGGGLGGSLLELLVNRGYQVSCGVLNELDADWEVAKDLEVEMVTTKAFSPINDEDYHRNLNLIHNCDYVVLANIPFGHGNVRNLLALQVAQRSGVRVILCNFSPITDRDFTHGQATGVYQQLIIEGAKCIEDVSQLWDLLVEQENCVEG